MRKRREALFLAGLLVLVSVTVLCSISTSANATKPPIFEKHEFNTAVGEYIRGQIVVKFKPEVSEKLINELNSRHGCSKLYKSPFADFYVLRIPEEETVSAMLKKYSEEPIVEYAQASYICSAFFVPDDPYYSYQWHFPLINMEQAWDVQFGGDPGIVVAVLDTGVAYENYETYKQAPDLAGTSFVQGYDFINNDTHPNDDNAHGTHVAGTIAQTTNNSYGVAGIAFKTSIMPVKVLDSTGSGTDLTLADGIRYAADNGADVISMSLGFASTVKPEDIPDVTEAVNYAYYNKSVILVASSGNDGGGVVSLPAAYPEVIAVGAVHSGDARASYSQYGSALEVVAPGGDGVDRDGNGYIDGVLQQTFNPTSKNPADFGFWFFTGTSQAAPHVSGLVALLLAQDQNRTRDQIRNILHTTSVDLGAPGWDEEYGWGRVNASAALDIVPPEISNVQAIDVTRVSATITWTTNETSTSIVRYGNTTPPTSEKSDSALVMSHYITLTGLTEDTLYYYETESADASGNTATDNNNGLYYNFTTRIAEEYDYVDNNVSDVDASPDKGTHSNFTAQQYGPDSIYDTLTEENTISFLVKKGTFTKITTTGAQTVSGVGFQPKAVIFWWTRQTSYGELAAVHAGYGFATYYGGAYQNRGAAFASDDAAAYSNTGRRRSETYSIIILSSGTPTLAAQASITAFNGDGFTLNWQTNEARADIIHFIALGGTDLTNAKAGTFSLTTSTGIQDITDVGFQPNFVMFLWTSTEAVDTNTAHAVVGMGFAVSSTKRGALVANSEDGRATMDTWQQQRTDSCILLLSPTSGAQDAIVDFSQFLSNGFQINNVDAPAATTPVFYLALKGGNYDVGSFNSPTATGDQDITGVGFQPKLVMLATQGRATATTIGSHAELALGAATSSTERGATWFEDRDALADSDNEQETQNTVVIRWRDRTAANTFTLRGSADFVSFLTDGFRLNWGNVETAGRAIIYVAFGGCNYALDLEVQWTNATYDQYNEELWIYGGTMGSENIRVDVWNGSAWQNLFTDLTSGWNKISVKDYLTSSTFTIRFKGGTETDDTSQDSWQIDCTLLHTWTPVGFDLNLRIRDWDLTDNIQGAYVYVDSDVKTSDVNGWANWTALTGTVYVKVKWYGAWVNGTSVLMDSDKTINVQCNIFDIMVTTIEGVQGAVLQYVNVTVYSGASVEENKIRTGITGPDGKVNLANVPNSTLTFTCYDGASPQHVTANITRTITTEDQAETITCDQNYISTTHTASIIVSYSNAFYLGWVLLPEFFLKAFRQAKCLKERIKTVRSKQNKGEGGKKTHESFNG